MFGRFEGSESSLLAIGKSMRGFCRKVFGGGGLSSSSDGEEDEDSGIDGKKSTRKGGKLNQVLNILDLVLKRENRCFRLLRKIGW